MSLRFDDNEMSKSNKLLDSIFLRDTGNGRLYKFATADQLCNPNLLDNWYFGNPVNQRNGYIVPAGVDYYTFTWEKVGQTDKNYQVLLRRNAENNYDCEIEINGTRYVVGGANSVPGYCGDRYTVDRWHLTTDGVLTVADEGIRLTSGALFQPFGYELSSLLKGKTVTYSFFFADNTLVTKSAVIPSTWGNWDNLIKIGDIQLIGLESGKRIWARYSSTTTAVAAKLELGDTQTLAHKEGDKWVLNWIPDYREQLRRCQRYCKVYPAEIMLPCVAFGKSNGWYASAILPFDMRTNPVNNLSTPLSAILVDLDSGDDIPSTISNWGLFNGGQKLRISPTSGSSDFTQYNTYSIQLKENLILSADL